MSLKWTSIYSKILLNTRLAKLSLLCDFTSSVLWTKWSYYQWNMEVFLWDSDLEHWKVAIVEFSSWLESLHHALRKELCVQLHCFPSPVTFLPHLPISILKGALQRWESSTLPTSTIDYSSQVALELQNHILELFFKLLPAIILG